MTDILSKIYISSDVFNRNNSGKNTVKLGKTPTFPYSNVNKNISTGCNIEYTDDFTTVDIPCTKKHLIKKLLLYVKRNRNGLPKTDKFYDKNIKLNRIYNGNHRKFKIYILFKNKVIQINFGPKNNVVNGECNG